MQSRLPCRAAAACSRPIQRGYVLPEGALEQIPLGSSQEQVLIVLGTPSTVATVSGEAFYYISQRGEKAAAFLPQKVVEQRVVAVYFDKERRVTRLADYGLKDGKIFDFVSRTTPTGGSELSYLTYCFKIVGDGEITLRSAKQRAPRLRGSCRFSDCGLRSVSEDRQQQQRHDVRDLDHRVHRRTGRVLVGIADRIAGHRGLVGFRALAAEMSVLDVFLGVVPGAAARGHRDRDEQAGHDHAEQHGADRREAGRLAGRAASPR